MADLLRSESAARYATGMTQRTDATVLASLLGMLERRERTACMAYREAVRADDEAGRLYSPISDRRKRARIGLTRAAARSTEAQEALEEARRITVQS